MRTVTFGVACSLDGYIARADHGVDWLLWSDEVQRISAEAWAGFDTVVMGRRTYEVALRNGIRAYPGVRNIVFSSTLDPQDHDAVEVVSDDAGETVRRLRTEPGRGICAMGGGVVARSLFEAGVVDQVALNVHPVILGDGIPLFHPLGRELPLELAECRPLSAGCVLLRYRVRGVDDG